jgi:hypothetical protein
LALAALLPTVASSQTKIVPVPAGDAAQIATDAVREAGHPCRKVIDAARLTDGTIRAKCSGGQVYRIFAVIQDNRRVLLALNWHAAKELGITGC